MNTGNISNYWERPKWSIARDQCLRVKEHFGLSQYLRTNLLTCILSALPLNNCFIS